MRGKRVAESSGERQRNCFVPMGVDAQRQCLAVIGAAKEKHGNAQEYNELQWLGLVWQIIEGYAQLRRSNECKAGERPRRATPSSGNELRSNEQKSKKGEDSMRTNLAVETTEERRERLREELEARRAARRIVKGMCLWVSGAAMILSAMAGTAEMTYECVVTGFVALFALLYGLA